MKKKITAVMEQITEDQAKNIFLQICFPAFCLFCLSYLLGMIFKKNLIIFLMITAFVGIITFVLVAPKLNQTKRTIGYVFLLIYPVLFVPGLINVAVFSLARSMADKGFGSGISILSFFALAASILGFSTYYASSSGKEKRAKIKEQLEKGSLISFNKQHSGDVVLCIEKESGKPEIWPYKDRFLHMLILGPTGSGKTSQTILPLLNQDIQNKEAGITVLEPKGDLVQKAAMMAKYYDRPVMYFDPSFKNCPHFNPLFGKESDVVENMATTFRMLNPDSPQFFLDLNEQLMRNAVKVLKRLDKAEGVDGKHATFIKLSKLLQNSGGEGRKMVVQFSQVITTTTEEAKENADIASWFLNDYFAERSKVYENTSGVRSQVAKLVSNEHLRSVLNPDFEKGERNEIDFDRHLSEGGVLCICTAQGTLRDLGRYLGYFIILQLQSAVFRRPGNENTRRAHFLYIDEFQTYSNPGFSDMLTQGRSYRVACHLSTQARAQMAMGGGRDGRNFVELVSTNARNIVLYPGCSTDDAEYYSKQFGEYEKEEVQTGKSYKTFNLFTGGLDRLGHPTEMVRKTKRLTAIFSPTDLIYRPFGEIVFCLIKNNSIQTPKVGIISYIPNDLNQTLDNMIQEFEAENKKETTPQPNAVTFEDVGEPDKKDARFEISDPMEDPEDPAAAELNTGSYLDDKKKKEEAAATDSDLSQLAQYEEQNNDLGQDYDPHHEVSRQEFPSDKNASSSYFYDDFDDDDLM